MKKPFLFLASGIVGLIAAPLWAELPAEVWYVNAGGGPGKVHFSVTSPGSESHFERAWFGWVWSESKINGAWPSPYPADRSFELIEMMPEISEASSTRSKSGTADELFFPPVEVGPGKELWLLRDNAGEALPVKEWEEFLDAVESAYRQVAPPGSAASTDPLAYRPIGKLGECTIYSVPTLPAGKSAVDGTWTSFTLPKAAPPQKAKIYDGDPSAQRLDVRSRRYLRWVDDCGAPSGEVTLQLYPIFSDKERYFLEIGQVKVRSLSWRDIASTGWTPGSRQLAEIPAPNKPVELPERQPSPEEDLCTLPSFEQLCANDKAMRERLYLVNPGSNIQLGRQDDLRVACEELIGPGKCPEDAFDLKEGAYLRNFQGNFKLSDKPEIWSEIRQGRVSWRFQKGSSQDWPSHLKQLGADEIELSVGEKPGLPWWGWVLIAASAVVSVLLLTKLYKKRRGLAEETEGTQNPREPGPSPRPGAKPPEGQKNLPLGRSEKKEPGTGDTPPEAPAAEPAKLGSEIEAQIKARVQSSLADLQKGGTAELKQSLDGQKRKIEELERQVQALSNGARSIDSRLAELRTSLKEDLKRELALEQRIEDARKKIRDAASDEKAAFQDSVKLAKEDVKTVQRNVLNKISDERDLTLRAVGEEAKKRIASESEKIQGDLMARAREAVAASQKDALAGFKVAARAEIAGVVDERWQPYTSFFEKIEPWFQEEEKYRLEQVAEVLALFVRVPNLGAHLEMLAERLPYEGFLSAVMPEHLDFSLAFRQKTDEEGRKLYEKLNREIASLEPASERESLDRSFNALGQLGLWIQALWGAMRVWGSFRDILEILPEPARQEWLSAFKLLRSFEVVDAVAFRRIARQRSGILDSAQVTRAEIDFLKGNGLLSGEKSLKDRLRLYLVPPGEPGHLGQACLALQYLVEAFPIEQIRDRTRYEEFSIRLRRAAETAGWPADFHSLIENAAAGAGLRYAAVPYYDSLVGDSRYRFIKQSIDVVDLVERTGRSLPSLDPKAVVRLLCPFFFQEELFYAGRAGIARQ